MKDMKIHQDIRHSDTLPAWFYRSTAAYEQSAERIFARSWQFIAPSTVVADNNSYYPFTLLPEMLDEPLLFSRDKNGQLRCLSNVCTHRAKIIVEEAGRGRLLSCGYHGRCFGLDGQMRSMPGFEGAANFPSERDHLQEIPMEEWMGLLFISIDPEVDFVEMTRPIRERLYWLPLDQMTPMPRESVDYEVSAHWALYCDNFLEGFHIPYVHPSLNEAIDFDQYSYESFDYGNLQLAIADEGQACFDIPPGAPDYGQKIYAYYYWLFPNLMLNFYPWGLSLNLIQPKGPKHCTVSFRHYFFPQTPHNQTNTNQINITELEDEAVVESVQKGLYSRFYNRGRFSPSMEQGVHHFHRLIAERMQ